MTTVIEIYKNKTSNTGNIMGVIRTMFPEIEVETFLQKRQKKNNRKP